MAPEPNIAERGMAVGLKALNKVASSGAIDRLGLRDPAVRLLHQASKTTGRTAARAGRTFAAAQRLSQPGAPAPWPGAPTCSTSSPPRSSRCCATRCASSRWPKLRPAASGADEACAAPPELLAQANELGLTMVGVPEELGGAVESARPSRPC